MKKESFFEKIVTHLTYRENYMDKLSREKFEHDYQERRITQELYEKIRTEGIPCSSCGYPVTPDTYGEIIETHDSPKKLQIICRHSLGTE